jgi:hypothetical protein
MAILCNFQPIGIEESLSGEWQLHVLTGDVGSGSSTPRIFIIPVKPITATLT